MGIGDFITKVAIRTVADMALSEVGHFAQEKYSSEALVNTSKSRYKLVIPKIIFSERPAFAVTDEFNYQKYTIRTKKTLFKKWSVYLYDNNGATIGSVKREKELFEMHATYGIYLDDTRLGTVTEKLSVKKKLDVDFNGWSLVGDLHLISRNYKIYDKQKKMIIQIHDAFGEEAYVMEYENKANEIMGLLLFMALALIECEYEESQRSGGE